MQRPRHIWGGGGVKLRANIWGGGEAKRGGLQRRPHVLQATHRSEHKVSLIATR